MAGVNGEQFRVSSSELRSVTYCSNGVIYRMNKVFEPAVFTYLTAPLFRYPQFSFYARAFNTKNMYNQTVDPNNRFTLFIQNDQDLPRPVIRRARGPGRTATMRSAAGPVR